ncbi:hypothetical protein F6A46_09490 [Tenacibaculum finnmarkense genomovar ulcerans]|uniref:hypothetical protein n=1 Tax=Tenacibaculum finnmarkense TaxID=2781243 RepID=UPI00187BBF9F|nr:hypothetical protein [Tenacibaculum finnmarkense]MBE7688468.1 hypothetical protein [Tenacibaculum finnmarkense genomovar ulcerans]
MAVTPDKLVFNYKKGTTLPPGRIVELDYSYTFVHPNKITVKNLNDWFYVTQDANNEKKVTVSLWGSNLKNLSTGTHSLSVVFYNTYQDKHYELGHPEAKIVNDPIGTLTVIVNIIEDILTISPNNLVYSYELGAEVVDAKSIKVTSGSDWTADFSNCGWISKDVVTGSAGTDKALNVPINTTGLAIGQYNAGVPVTNSGGVTQVLNVTLNITAGKQEYLYATPTDLMFNYTISGNLPPSKRIELNVSKQWTATTEDAWLLLGATEGAAGVGFFDIGVQNVTEFTVGKYSGTVKLTTGGIEQLINVVLVVREFTKETLSETTLYFSDDQNNIVISSEGLATYLAIDVVTEYNNETFKYPSAVPFFNGIAKKRIGAVVNKIINNEPDLVLDEISLKTPYSPALLTIDVQETEIYSDEVTEGVKLNKIPFVKGVTPFDNWLSDNTKEMYLTNKGVVSFNFFNPLLTAVTEIEITGSINKTVTFPAVSSYFNNVKIPLNLLDLKEGDAIIITAHNTIVTVFIKPNTPDNALVFWENKWGVFDSLEFTGDLAEKDNYKSEDFSYRKDHLTTETKVLSVVNKTSFKLNTGPLYTYESIEVVSKMLKSKNIKLIYQNEIIAVKSTTKTLSRPKISENNKSFNLTFEKLIK